MRPLSRRAALLLPAALGGCSIFDSWFGAEKPPLPGERLPVLAARRGLEVDAGNRTVTLPLSVANSDWMQPGRIATHDAGHLAVREGAALSEAWRESIGEGGGYRRKITAQPIISDGRVFTMDSDAVITAFDTKTGGRVWRVVTQDKEDRSTNVGGGISTDGHAIFAATGRGDAVALDAATGKLIWRKSLATAARGAPTFADDKLFIPTLDDTLVALSATDGGKLWSHQASTADTAVLGEPAPAYADGIVVAGFGSGDLIALRAASGSVAWADSLASASGRNSLIDLSSVRGLPVIRDGAVFAGSLGGLLISLDLRTGRRLWEREVATDQTPSIVGDWVFIVSAEQQIAAIGRTDGAVAWLTQLPQFGDEKKRTDPFRWLGPLAVGNRLIVAGTNETALAIDPFTGKILGEQKLRGPASVSPSVADGTVFFVTDDGTLAAFR